MFLVVLGRGWPISYLVLGIGQWDYLCPNCARPTMSFNVPKEYVEAARAMGTSNIFNLNSALQSCAISYPSDLSIAFVQCGRGVILSEAALVVLA